MPAAPQIGVLSVDDNPMIGESLESLIRRAPGLRWDGFLPSGEGVVEAVGARGTGVVVLDMDIPGTDTCALVEELGRACPATRVLIMSGYMQPQYIEECLAAGAAGYIGKEHEPQYVVDSIRRIAAGEVVVCEEALLALAKRSIHR